MAKLKRIKGLEEGLPRARPFQAQLPKKRRPLAGSLQATLRCLFSTSRPISIPVNIVKSPRHPHRLSFPNVAHRPIPQDGR